jgi:hypothetical protein
LAQASESDANGRLQHSFLRALEAAERDDPASLAAPAVMNMIGSRVACSEAAGWIAGQTCR